MTDMYVKKKTLMLILSDVCVAECEVCYGSCSPKNNNIMDEALMLGAIRQAKEKGLAEYIAFGGGEPFVHYDLLKTGLEHAKKAGLETSVCTNGFWGKWSDGEIAEKIGTLPIDSVVFRTSAYHEKFVPETDFSRAVEHFKKMRLPLFLEIGETKSSESAVDFFNDKLGDYKYLCNLMIFPFLREGKARGLGADCFQRLVRTEDARCVSENIISVRYDGEVFPCCGSLRYDSAFSMGNASRRGLSEIIGENAAFLSFLGGSGALQKMILTAKDSMEFPDFCIDGCEICRSIMENKEIRKRLTDGGSAV